jgi:hypothetical protein
MSETSRRNREIYVGSCEWLGVKVLRPTLQLEKRRNRSKSSVRAKVEHLMPTGQPHRVRLGLALESEPTLNPRPGVFQRLQR